MRFRHCPNCGAEGLQRVGPSAAGHVRCGGCDEVHYDNPAVTAFAFVEHAGRFLVLQRNAAPCRDGWDLPGGFVEPGEAPGEAVLRELWEETQLVATDLELLGAYKSRYGRFRWTVDVGFVCRASSDAVVLSSEKRDHRWLELSAIPTLAFAGERDALADLSRDASTRRLHAPVG